MIDWSSLVEYLITFVAGGGLVKLLTWKQDNRQKKIENDMRCIEKYESLFDRLMSLYNEKIKSNEELSKKIFEIQNENSELKNSLIITKFMRCSIVECPKREPKFKIGNIDNKNI